MINKGEIFRPSKGTFFKCDFGANEKMKVFKVLSAILNLHDALNIYLSYFKFWFFDLSSEYTYWLGHRDAVA